MAARTRHRCWSRAGPTSRGWSCRQNCETASRSTPPRPVRSTRRSATPTAVAPSAPPAARAATSTSPATPHGPECWSCRSTPGPAGRPKSMAKRGRWPTPDPGFPSRCPPATSGCSSVTDRGTSRQESPSSSAVSPSAGTGWCDRRNRPRPTPSSRRMATIAPGIRCRRFGPRGADRLAIRSRRRHRETAAAPIGRGAPDRPDTARGARDRAT